MSSNFPPTPTPAAGTEPEPAVLTPDEIVRLFRTVRAQLEAEVPPVRRRGRTTHVNADFVQASVNAAGTSELVQGALGRTGEDLRRDIEASGRWTAVTDELRVLLRLSIAADSARRHRIGLTALQTYQICRSIVRDESNTRLVAHVDEMRRLNKFGRPRRKPPAQPAPEPQAPNKL